MSAEDIRWLLAGEKYMLLRPAGHQGPKFLTPEEARKQLEADPHHRNPENKLMAELDCGTIDDILGIGSTPERHSAAGHD